MADTLKSAHSDRAILRWGILAAAAALALAFYVSGLGDVLSLASIAERQSALKAMVRDHWGLAIAAYALAYAAAVALSIPCAALMTMLGGFLFGWFGGGLVSVIAATAGSTLVFLLARSWVGDALTRRAGPRLQALSKGLRKDALNYLLFLRLIPVFPFWLVNIAAGLFNVPFRAFLVATLLGMLPAAFAYAALGRGLDGLIVAERQVYEACLARGETGCKFELNVYSLLSPGLIAALVAVGMLALLPVLVRRFRRTRTAGPE